MGRLGKAALLLAFGGLCLVAAGCGGSASGPAASGRSLVDNSELVSGGVLRVELATQLKFIDVTVSRMTGMDAVFPGPPARCVTASLGRHLAYYDLNWRSVKNDTALPAVSLSLATPAGVPLVAQLPDGTCRTMKNYRVEALPANNGEQYVLQLFSARSRQLTSLTAQVDGTPSRVPLVPTCGNRLQPDSMSCTVDPIGYDSGAPYTATTIAH